MSLVWGMSLSSGFHNVHTLKYYLRVESFIVSKDHYIIIKASKESLKMFNQRYTPNKKLPHFISMHIWITESIQITPNIHRQMSHIKSARKFYFPAKSSYIGLGIHCSFQWDDGHGWLRLNHWLIPGWGWRWLDLSQQ